jgi:hypothetical protein
MKYCVIEMKTKLDETLSVNTFKKDTLDEANRAYHSILASASVSDALFHSATILDWRGKEIKSEYYKHEEEPQPEPEEPKEIEEEPKEGE